MNTKPPIKFLKLFDPGIVEGQSRGPTGEVWLKQVYIPLNRVKFIQPFKIMRQPSQSSDGPTFDYCVGVALDFSNEILHSPDFNTEADADAWIEAYLFDYLQRPKE